MLTFGIILMVASIVLGVVTLTSVALMSSAARSAGRRARAAVSRRQGAFNHAAAGKGTPSHRAERRATAYPPGEDPPRWVLALASLSGAGLVLGLVLVMVASIL